MTATFTYTSDFHSEFLSETRRLLHRRFIWFLIFTLVAHLVYMAVPFVFIGQLGAAELAARLSMAAVDIGVCIVFLVHTVRSRPYRERLIRLSYWFFIYNGAAYIATALLGGPLNFPGMVMFFHVLATLLLPWTPRQAIRPIVPLLLLHAIGVVMTHDATSAAPWLRIALSLLAIVPGLVIAWFKHARRTESFKLRFLQSRYGQMRRELVDARRIHESLFPPPERRRDLQFDYRYVPMRQIGGDYLYASFGGEAAGRFNMVLVDVTGHGIAAALTVNRLSGEVERLYAETPEARPGDVLRALNRYVHLTMSRHSVYATALCMSVDTERDAIEYASGGHPPAFLRQADGRIEQLDSTTFVLGACADADFDPEEQSRPFHPGDVVIACTDGAIECRDESGRMLGVMGVLRAITSGAPVLDGGWSQALLDVVEAHRAGPPDDDTLLVEVARPLRPVAGRGTDSRRPARAAH